jgi:hypothetical protein
MVSSTSISGRGEDGCFGVSCSSIAASPGADGVDVAFEEFSLGAMREHEVSNCRRSLSTASSLEVSSVASPSSGKGEKSRSAVDDSGEIAEGSLVSA